MEQNRACVAVVVTVSMELDRVNVRRIHEGSGSTGTQYQPKLVPEC